jgi:hypothetical protein
MVLSTRGNPFYRRDGGGVLALGLEELPAQWSATMLTEFTWMLPTLELPLVFPEALLALPVEEVAEAVFPLVLADAEGCEEPAVPVLALAEGVNDPVIWTSWPTWLLS